MNSLAALRRQRNALNAKIVKLVARQRKQRLAAITKEKTKRAIATIKWWGKKSFIEEYGTGKVHDEYSNAPANRCAAVILDHVAMHKFECEILGVKPTLKVTRCSMTGSKEHEGRMYCGIHYGKPRVFALDENLNRKEVRFK